MVPRQPKMRMGLRPNLSDSAPHHLEKKSATFFVRPMYRMEIFIHSRDRLSQREGRDEQASIEGGIALVADIEV